RREPSQAIDEIQPTQLPRGAVHLPRDVSPTATSVRRNGAMELAFVCGLGLGHDADHSMRQKARLQQPLSVRREHADGLLGQSSVGLRSKALITRHLKIVLEELIDSVEYLSLRHKVDPSSELKRCCA